MTAFTPDDWTARRCSGPCDEADCLRDEDGGNDWGKPMTMQDAVRTVIAGVVSWVVFVVVVGLLIAWWLA